MCGRKEITTWGWSSRPKGMDKFTNASETMLSKITPCPQNKNQLSFAHQLMTATKTKHLHYYRRSKRIENLSLLHCQTHFCIPTGTIKSWNSTTWWPLTSSWIYPSLLDLIPKFPRSTTSHLNLTFYYQTWSSLNSKWMSKPNQSEEKLNMLNPCSIWVLGFPQDTISNQKYQKNKISQQSSIIQKIKDFITNSTSNA